MYSIWIAILKSIVTRQYMQQSTARMQIDAIDIRKCFPTRASRANWIVASESSDIWTEPDTHT